MSSSRKSTRTSVPSEKLKSSVAKRAVSARGKKQLNSSSSNADARDGETADNDESSTVDGEDRSDSQDENRSGSGVDDDVSVSDDGYTTAGNGLAADNAGSAAGNVDDGSAKRRTKTKKQRKQKERGEGSERESDAGRKGQGMAAGWLDDTDDIFEEIGDDGEDLAENSSVGDIFVSSVARLGLVSQGAIFSSVIHGSGRDALVGSMFVILHERLPGSAENLFPVCIYQVAQTPSNPEGPRRAARIATSFPDISSSVPSKSLPSSEVTAIDFLPDTGLLFVSARGWSQAQTLAGRYLRLALPGFFLPVTFLAAPKTASTKKAPAAGTGAASSKIPSPTPNHFAASGSLVPKLGALGSLSSVPNPSELKGDYRHLAKSMHRLAPSVIAQAEALSKESSKSAMYDRATRKREESVQGGKTLVKLGASIYLLEVLSIAAAEVFVMPLATIAAAFHHRLSCPINMVVMAQFVGSWKLGDGGRCLSAFTNLSRAHGPIRAVWRAREYSSLQEVELHSDIYNRNMEGEDGKILGPDVAIAEEATMNLLLLIFMLTGMRYSLQAAMIGAVGRAFVFIRANDFGMGSPYSPILIRAVLVELFIQLDYLRTQILSFRCADDSHSAPLRVELIAAIGDLPNLAAGSETGLILERLRLGERDTNVGYLLGLNSIAMLSPVGAVTSVPGSLGSVLDTDLLVGKRRKRSKGKLASGATAAVSVGQSSPAAAVVTAVVAQTVGSPAVPVVAGSGSAGAGTPVAVPGRVAVQYCHKFLSAGGCQFAAANGGRVCKFVHRVPARASPEYALVAARLLSLGVAQSAGFIAAV